MRRAMEPFARALQRAYARAIRSSGPRVPHEGTRGPPGGSLADDVLGRQLLRFERWGFVFTPSKLGRTFALWWHGTRRQRARGRTVPVDADRLARELEADLARQIEAEDRRTR